MDAGDRTRLARLAAHGLWYGARHRHRVPGVAGVVLRTRRRSSRRPRRQAEVADHHTGVVGGTRACARRAHCNRHHRGVDGLRVGADARVRARVRQPGSAIDADRARRSGVAHQRGFAQQHQLQRVARIRPGVGRGHHQSVRHQPLLLPQWRHLRHGGHRAVDVPQGRAPHSAAPGARPPASSRGHAMCGKRRSCACR